MSFLSDTAHRSQESEWKRYFISNIRAFKMLYDRGINISSFDPRQLTNADGLVSDFLDLLFGQELTWDSLGVDDDIDYDDNRLNENHEDFDEDYYYEVSSYSERPHYMINIPLKTLQDLSSRLRPRHYKRIMKSLEGVTPGIEPEEIHPDWSLFKEVDWLKDHNGRIINKGGKKPCTN